MKILLVIIACSHLQALNDQQDSLIFFGDSGIWIDNDTSSTTLNQGAMGILLGEDKGLKGCSLNERCCKRSKGSCNSAQVTQDLTVALENITKSSSLLLGQIARTLIDVISQFRDLFKNNGVPVPQKKLTKHIKQTFQIFETILSNQTNSLGVVKDRISSIVIFIQSDLLNITEAPNMKSKDVAVCGLGNHVILLMDMITELMAVISSVSNLVTSDLYQGTFSTIMLASTTLFFVSEILAADATLCNDSSTSIQSTIFLHVSVAVEKYITVVQRISQASSVQSLKESLPKVTGFLCTTTTRLSDDISSATGFVNEYSVPNYVSAFADCIITAVRSSKHLRNAEEAFKETIFSLYDISITILAARFACFQIEGFTKIVELSIKKVLECSYAVIVLFANIDDYIFSCANTLLMFLITLDSMVGKVIHSIKNFITSIRNIKIVYGGSSGLINLFEAVVNVAMSCVQLVAHAFTELQYGTHLINLQKSMTNIVDGVRYRLDVAKNILNDKLKDDWESIDNTEIYEKASRIMSSNIKLKHNIADVVCSLHDTKGNPAHKADEIIQRVEAFLGKLKSNAERLSQDSIGLLPAGILIETIDDVRGVLLQLATVTLDKCDIVNIVFFALSNNYYSVFSMSSILNLFGGGINMYIY